MWRGGAHGDREGLLLKAAGAVVNLSFEIKGAGFERHAGEYAAGVQRQTARRPAITGDDAPGVWQDAARRDDWLNVADLIYGIRQQRRGFNGQRAQAGIVARVAERHAVG